MSAFLIWIVLYFISFNYMDNKIRTLVIVLSVINFIYAILRGPFKEKDQEEYYDRSRGIL